MVKTIINTILEKLSSDQVVNVEKRWIFGKGITKKEKEAMLSGYQVAVEDFKIIIRNIDF